MIKQHVVGIADMKICRNEGEIITYALGSCIGICIYDAAIRMAGMVHIMLPNNQESNGNVFKYADTGISEMIKRMEMLGSARVRMTAKIAGGARMFDIPGDGSLGNIGQRNMEAARNTLLAQRIRLIREDVGANYARTMLFNSVNGDVFIRTHGKPELKL